jgi:hypothetical protein
MKYFAAGIALAMMCLACQGETRPPQILTPVVVSGKQAQVGFFYGLNPDCSTRGEGDIRLIKKPEHGTVEFTQGESFPNYPQTSPWHHCNKQKVPGSLVTYKSDEGYIGKEYFDVEFIGPRGADIISKYVVTVK